MDKLKQYLVKSVQAVSAVNISPLLFMVSFSWLLLLDTLERNGRRIQYDDMFLLFSYGTVILLLQYIAVKRINHLFPNKFLYYLMIATMFCSNFGHFYLFIAPDFLQLAHLWKILILLVIGAIFFIIVKYSERWVFILGLVACISVFLFNMIAGQQLIFKNIVRFVAPESFSSFPLPENYMPQDFIKKPNIYLLSFDAMAAENTITRLLDLQPDERPKYFDTIEDNQAIMIPNAFSASDRTTLSFATMLSLDKRWYDEVAINDKSQVIHMLTGVQWTPTYDSFYRNGYDLQLVYKSDFFKNFVVTQEQKLAYWFSEKVGFCAHIHNIYSLWGYCLSKRALTSSQNKIENLYRQRLQVASLSDKPVFTLAYIYSPGHTELSHNANKESQIEQYKKKYLANSIKTADILQNYIDIIRANDTDGIIIIFADHGAWVTRGVETKNKDSSFDKKDIIQDRQGIVMAVLDPSSVTPDGCQIAEPIVTTLPDMMYNLITCLTGGKPVLKKRHNSEAEFIDYLYDPIS
nr:hypothetical protein [Alphaproteobacteria bacterium]